MNKQILDLILERTAIEREIKRSEFADVFGTETDESTCVDGSQVEESPASEGAKVPSFIYAPSNTVH